MLATVLASPAFAQEPVGCDKFKWPVDRERAALQLTDLATFASGTDSPLPMSGVVKLQPVADAHLPTAPERAPNSGAFAAFLSFKTATVAAPYTISLSAPAWLDVIQGGNTLKPIDFSGVTGCDGIRKVVKFQIAAAPFTLQISGVATDQIKIAVLPAQE
jgi:hypothetical protein